MTGTETACDGERRGLSAGEVLAYEGGLAREHVLLSVIVMEDILHPLCGGQNISSQA